LLCNGDPDYIAVYAPADQKSFLAPPNKVTLLYGLCRTCQQQPDWAEKAEQRIHAEPTAADPLRN
jgi:hypothetical protein